MDKTNFELEIFNFECVLAGVAQLVEHDLAKVGVASSSLVSRSITCQLLIDSGWKSVRVSSHFFVYCCNQV